MNKNNVKTPEPEMLDPDARFLLANERTLLAWIRTALALMAGGILLTHLDVGSDYGKTIGILTILMGAVMSLVGYVRFKAADAAIRTGQLPETGNGLAAQVAGVVIFSFALIFLALLM